MYCVKSSTRLSSSANGRLSANVSAGEGFKEAALTI